jgi:hypothetical protein
MIRTGSCSAASPCLLKLRLTSKLESWRIRRSDREAAVEFGSCRAEVAAVKPSLAFTLPGKANAHRSSGGSEPPYTEKRGQDQKGRRPIEEGLEPVGEDHRRFIRGGCFGRIAWPARSRQVVPLRSGFAPGKKKGRLRAAL